MKSISELLNNNLDNKEAFKIKRQNYNKDWNNVVKCFQRRINKDMRKEKRKEFGFFPIRMKLSILKEVDDLKWFYNECLKYSYTKDKKTGKRNTFSRAFWGALKIR